MAPSEPSGHQAESSRAYKPETTSFRDRALSGSRERKPRCHQGEPFWCAIPEERRATSRSTSLSSYPSAMGRKSRAKRERRIASRRLPSAATEAAVARPHPLVAIEGKHRQLAERLAKRGDRFSRLLSRALRDEHQGQHLVSRSGLSRAEHDELDLIQPEAHEALRHELQSAHDHLREVLGSGDPLHIVSTVQYANLFAEWGSYYEPTHEGSEAKVELVCGFLATQPPNLTGARPAPAAMQAIFDELDHIQDVIWLLNLSMPRGEDLTAASLRFSSTLRWLSVRGTSFDIHGQDLAREIYRPHDEWLLATFGFAIDDVLAVGDAVEALMAKRVTDLVREGTDIWKAADKSTDKTMAAAVIAGLELFDDRIRGVSSFALEDLMRFRPSLDHGRARAVLDELSIEVGSLEPKDYTGLFDVNPLRERPFLRLSDDYVLAIPGMLSRDADTLLEHRALTRRPTFPRQRATTLDRLAIRYLTELLPDAAAHTNLFYEGAELDGLVLLDDLALVVEGKAGGMSVAARRGELARLRRDIRENVEKAWRQGARARAFLLRNEDSVFTDDRGDVVLRVPAGSVKEVGIVNPTLHELGGHASQLSELRALGLFPDGEYPWSVFINDLRAIAETSDNAAVFLHYLTWRNRLPLGDQVVVWDELDLWASYLLCERFGMLAEGSHVLVANASTDFDAYYEGLAGRGPEAKRPGKFLEEPARGFVARMAAERPPGWRTAAGACLDLSIPELAVVAVKAEEVAQEAATSGAVVGFDAGRLALLGVPQAADARQIVSEYAIPSGDPTFVVVSRLSGAAKCEIAWAGYRKPVTFELSPFEQASYNAASPFARD